MHSSDSYGVQRTVSGVGHANSNSRVTRPRLSPEISRSQAGKSTSQNELNRQDRKRRVIAYYTHALVTFHTFGIPLSAGLTLEYYYNTLFVTTSLKNLVLIFGIQWVGIFAMELLAAGVFRWKHWRWASIGVTIMIIVCHGVMARAAKMWTVALGMHAVVGLCLGFLRSVTMRCLSSHYNNDVAAVSVQSGAAAMLGALVYSLVAWSFLRVDKYQKLAWANFYIVLFVLSPAIAGLFKATKLNNKSVTPKHERLVPRLRHRKSTQAIQLQSEVRPVRRNSKTSLFGDGCFLGGYFLVVAFAFVWPTFLPLLFTSRPLYEYPEFAAFWLFGLFSAAAMSATLFTSSWPRRGVGVVNTFAAAGIFAGALLIIAAWAANFWIWGLISVLYGLCHTNTNFCDSTFW